MKLHSSDLANGSSKKPRPVPHCQAQRTSPCVLSPSKFNVMSSQSHVLHYRVLPPSELYVMSSHSHVSHCRVLPPGEFSVMSSQSYMLHCRVLPPGEFNVMIPEPHATLQGHVIPQQRVILQDAATWQIIPEPRVTLQGAAT